MDQGKELYRAILENPFDDQARLIFADHLEETGDEQAGLTAERLRLQVELARLRRLGKVSEYDEKGPELLRRSDELSRRAGGAGWALKIPPVIDVAVRYEYERGFINSVELRLFDFPVNAKELFLAAPITRVVLRDRSPRYDRESEAWVWYGSQVTANDLIVSGMQDAPTIKPFGESHWIPSDLLGIFGRLAFYGAIGERQIKQQAIDYLGDRCVAYGRKEAGLVELPPNEVS